MKNLILVTGSEGLVGSRFVEISQRKNFLHLPKEIELDITDKSEIKAVIESYNFSAVVNFAAFTNVGKAEEEKDDKEGDCWQVNVEGVRNFTEAIKPHKERIHFIQISTDMVFPGSLEDPGAYEETHPPESDSSKLNWYGFTKSEAERVVGDVLGNSGTILRIIYPVRARFEAKLDYLRKFLKLYDAGKLYPVFSDQQISITYIDEACHAIDKIIIEGHKGIFHASSSDITTPYELVTYLLDKTRGVKDAPKAISLEEHLTKTGSSLYRYPKFGGLKVDITEAKLGIKFSTWKEIVDKLISQGIGK